MADKHFNYLSTKYNQEDLLQTLTEYSHPTLH